MKALSTIAIFFAVFLIVLGVASRVKNGDALGLAAVTGGILILIFVAAVWIAAFVKGKKDRENDFDDS